MAFQITWSRSALGDLEALVRYIARDDAEVAEKFGKLVISKVEKAAAFPRIGRIVPEFREEQLREIIAAPYRIVYQINDHLNVLTILRLARCARGY